MEQKINFCSNEEHSNIEAIYYCIECKIYMCNKCENFHSKMLKNHHKVALEKNKNISEIFTGFCKEENHSDKLEYFCKQHNQLCCSGCIAKIKLKNKGQHSDCEVCPLEEIKEKKNNILKENIKNLEKLSNQVDGLINEMKIIFEEINKNKEELKLNIQQIFTKIRNSINAREDEILLSVDQLYNSTYIEENEISQIEKFPNKIKSTLKQGKDTLDKWKNEELNLLINNCIVIEKNIVNINDTENKLKKCKEEISSVIKFNPSDDDKLDEFISKLTEFGSLFKENKNLNLIDIKQIEQNNINIKISSTKQELTNFSFHLYHFSDKEFSKYYPENSNYKNDEMVLTFLLGEENDNNKEYFNNLIQNNNRFRKYNNKFYLDFNFPINDKILNIIDLYEPIFYLNYFSLEFKNNFTFENFLQMKFDEFFKIFGSFVLEIKGNFTNLENSLKSFEQKKSKNEEVKRGIIKIIKFIMFNKNIRFIYDITQERLLEFIEFQVQKTSDDLNKDFMPFIHFLIKNWSSYFLKSFFGKDGIKYLNFDKVLITALDVNLKSGFALETNSKGINDYLKILPNIH